MFSKSSVAYLFYLLNKLSTLGIFLLIRWIRNKPRFTSTIKPLTSNISVSVYLWTLPAISFNPFHHIDAFWRLCSKRLFENKVTKEEIARNEQYLLLPQCCPLFVIGYPFNFRDFLYFDNICSKSSAELLYEGKG